MARPSKYDPSYCASLVQHMREGLSFPSFAATVGVNKDSLYEWVKSYPEFSESKKLGEAHSLLFWERLGISAVRGEISGFNATAFVFCMKNKHGWRSEPKGDAETVDDRRLIIEFTNRGEPAA